MTSLEQFHSIQLSSIEAIFGISAKALEGAEQLVTLNLQTAKRLLSEAQEATQASASSRNPQELIAQQFSAQALTHGVDKAIAYWRHAYTIVTTTADEVAKLIETDASEAKSQWMSALDAAIKNAPAGTETVVTLMKTALDGANQAYGGLQKATRKAAEAAETGLDQVIDSTHKSAAGATGKGRQHAEA